MVQTMSGTPQPHILSALISGFGSLATRHAFAVNLVVVIVLAALGAVFLTGRPGLVRYAMWFGVAFCLADWVLVEDLGFLGGLGTDPNSMIPMALLFSVGYLALSPEMAVAETAGDQAPGRLRSLRPGVLGGMLAAAGARSVAAVAALAVIILGAAPMASAAANRTADPILALAI